MGSYAAFRAQEADAKAVALVKVNARVAELERSLALANRQIDNMSFVLRQAREKIVIERAHSSGVYRGGIEHTELLRRIDAVMPNK